MIWKYNQFLCNYIDRTYKEIHCNEAYLRERGRFRISFHLVPRVILQRTVLFFVSVITITYNSYCKTKKDCK